MKRLSLIIGSIIGAFSLLVVFLAGTAWAVDLNVDQGCFGCQPVIHLVAGESADFGEGGPSINLSKTVGTDSSLCASTDTIVFPPGGGNVYYCYYIQNTGNVTLTLHTVVDDQIGTLLGPDFPFALMPGASAWFSIGASITETVINTAVWTAQNPGPTDVVTSSDTAEVVVESLITALTATNNSPTRLGDVTTLDTIVEGGGNESFEWDFGDGMTGTGSMTTHIYPAIGVYTAVVTATNSLNSLSAVTLVEIGYLNYLPVVLRP